MTVYKRGCRIAKVKHQILRENHIDIPCERWRFLDYSGNSIGEVLNDDDQLLLYTDGICIQELPEEGLVSDTQLLLYVRRWNRSKLQLEEIHDIIVDKDNYNDQLKNKVSNISSSEFAYQFIHTRILNRLLLIPEYFRNCKSFKNHKLGFRFIYLFHNNEFVIKF